MTDGRQFKNILENAVKSSDDRDKEEYIQQLLNFDQDLENAEHLVESSLNIKITEKEKDFLIDYKQALTEKREWAEKINPTKAEKYKKNTYMALKNVTSTLREEIQEAVEEDIELENIAAKLEDPELARKTNRERDQLKTRKNRLDKIIDTEKSIEEFLEKIGGLEEKLGGLQHVNTALETRITVVEIILDHTDIGSRREEGNRRIIIPEKYLGQLRESAERFNEEITGILICRKDGRDWTVLKVLRTGIGTEGSVSPDTERVSAVNDLIGEHASYRLVEFHTHSAGTIVHHGPKYAEDWSKGDIENFKDQGKGYIGMLVTPKTVLLKGNKGDPQLNTVNRKKTRKFDEWRDQLEEDFGAITSNYSFRDLPKPTEFNP